MLSFRLPKTVEIAAGIYGDGPVIARTEGRVWFFARLGILALTAVFVLNIAP